MNLPENDYQILRLTDKFYNDYPDPPYREIMKKQQQLVFNEYNKRDKVTSGIDENKRRSRVLNRT